MKQANQLHPVVSDLALVIGLENADALCRHFSGCVLTLPTAATLDRLARDEIIREDVKTMSVADVAKKHQISPRQVSRIKNG